MSVLVLGLAVNVPGGAVGTAGAAPAPTFSAVLADDGACVLTLTATWQRAKVDQVFGLWYLDDSFLLTTEAPGTGPNAGTLSRRTAVFQAGAFAATPGTSHTWQVRVQFSYRGAFVGEVWSNVDTAPCAIA